MPSSSAQPRPRPHRAQGRAAGRIAAVAAAAGGAALAGVLGARTARAGHHGSTAATPTSTSAPPVAVRPSIEERLARMIQAPTVSAEGATRQEAFDTFIYELLPELYPRISRQLHLERVTDRGLLYRWPGASDDRPAVLMAHFDVVPAHEEDGWSQPPFEGRIDRDAGVVIGRGALDDKGALVTLLDAVENLLAAEFVPAHDIYLSLGGNEETDGNAAEAIADRLHERGVDPWIVVDEGGAVVDPPFPGVTRQAAMVGIAEKGVLTVRLHAAGRGGHASAPGNDNAIAMLAGALFRLRRSPFPITLSAPAIGMLETIAASTPFPVRLVLANLWLFAPAVARAFVAASPELAAITRTTLAPTRIDGGTANNVLPSTATATLNLRLAPGESVDSALERLRHTINDARLALEVVEAHEPSPVSPIDDAQFALVRAAIGASYPEAVATPYLMMQATDSRHFHRYVEHVYRFAPLFMSAEERASIHGTDERVRIDSLRRGEQFYQSLIRGLPGA